MITAVQPKIQNIHNKKHQNFKGAPEVISTAMNFLNTNPSLGAVFVDVAFMDTPRTIVDTARNPDAGVETAAREYSSTINHSIAGLVGIGAGSLVSSAFNKATGTKAHLIFTDSNSIDVFGKFIEESGGDSEKFFTSVAKAIRGYNTTEAVEGNYKKLSSETAELLGKEMAASSGDSYKLPKKVYAKVNYLVTGELGASETIKITKDGKTIVGRLENIVKDSFSMWKAYLDKSAHQGAEELSNAKFFEGIKNLKTKTALAGLAVPVAIGMSLQPLNAYMTKKRTGKEGFVGKEGREPDKSAGFKLLKTGMGAGIAATMLRTIAPYKEIIPKLQYKGLVPTIPQFKLIYSMTIFSRMLAARDKDELRESTIKDTLGFVNWLILGGFVSKLAANKLDKDLINYDEKTFGAEGKSKFQKGWKWITKAAEKSHEEILFPALKKAGLDIKDEKGNILSFGKLMKKLADKAKSPEASDEIKTLFAQTSKKIKYKNIAQALGYIYSGVVLGVGIPKLNIAITNYCEKKKLQNADVKATVIDNQAQDAEQNYVHIAEADFIDEPMQIQNMNTNKTFASFLGKI